MFNEVENLKVAVEEMFKAFADMHIDFYCPKCETEYRLYAHYLGRSSPEISCKCGYRFLRGV